MKQTFWLVMFHPIQNDLCVTRISYIHLYFKFISYFIFRLIFSNNFQIQVKIKKMILPLGQFGNILKWLIFHLKEHPVQKNNNLIQATQMSLTENNCISSPHFFLMGNKRDHNHPTFSPWYNIDDIFKLMKAWNLTGLKIHLFWVCYNESFSQLQLKNFQEKFQVNFMFKFV